MTYAELRAVQAAIASMAPGCGEVIDRDHPLWVIDAAIDAELDEEA